MLISSVSYISVSQKSVFRYYFSISLIQMDLYKQENNTYKVNFMESSIFISKWFQYWHVSTIKLLLQQFIAYLLCTFHELTEIYAINRNPRHLQLTSILSSNIIFARTIKKKSSFVINTLFQEGFLLCVREKGKLAS